MKKKVEALIKKHKLDSKNTKAPREESDEFWEKLMKKNIKKIKKLQEKLYAQSKFSVLIALQGMDTAGKDSLIRKVFGPLNPAGVKVHAFKSPTKEELNHDYLWRHYKKLPAQGEITVFNRTHYENVLVTRVHPEYILSRDLPEINTVEDVDDDFWKRRFQHINQVEDVWAENGMLVLKFFLNISKDTQKQRLIDRLENPEKHWKFDAGDLKERSYWSEYQHAYKEMLDHTSQPKTAPWFSIPADSKPYARYLVSEITLELLEDLPLDFPESSKDIKTHVEDYLNQLNAD
ncbi:MAG: PPK2 family polyphosphate kinase [Flavobacteriales bacterium]